MNNTRDVTETREQTMLMMAHLNTTTRIHLVSPFNFKLQILAVFTQGVWFERLNCKSSSQATLIAHSYFLLFIPFVFFFHLVSWVFPTNSTHGETRVIPGNKFPKFIPSFPSRKVQLTKNGWITERNLCPRKQFQAHTRCKDLLRSRVT